MFFLFVTVFVNLFLSEHLKMYVLGPHPEVIFTIVSLVFVKEISPEYSLEGLMLKLKCQYFSQLMPTAKSLKRS